MQSETSYGCVLAARPGVAVRANLALKETGDLWVVPAEDIFLRKCFELFELSFYMHVF